MKNLSIISVLLVLCSVLLVTACDWRSDVPTNIPQTSSSNTELSIPYSSSATVTSSDISDSSASEAEPKFIPPAVELTPQIEFTIDHHIGTLIACNAVFQSWETTAQMDPDSVVSFYISLSRDDERLPQCTVYTPKHPEFGRLLLYSQYIEQVGALYFGVSPDMMRKSSYYYEPEDCYELWGLGSIVSHTINKVETIENETVIYFDMYRDATPENSGALTIQNNPDGSWQYKSFELLEFGTLTPVES